MSNVYAKIARYFKEEYQGCDEATPPIEMTVEDLRELAGKAVEYQSVCNQLKETRAVIAKFEAQRTEEKKAALQEFLTGNWVDSKTVQEVLGLTFEECFRLFDFSRTSTWWSIAGKTEEERKREGQKVVCQFRLKEKDRWIPVTDHLPKEKGWYQCSCYDPEVWSDGLVRDLYFRPETKEFVDHIRYFCNGMKDIEKYYWTKYVVAWQPLPDRYRG